ncbi:MAG TPA: hypothetical protein VN753_07645 [Terracidiphilus sp.]|nr:hypothetical protein [Terracidiphilus sp.]
MLAFWHLASLDAPTVAIVWALAIAHSAGNHLKPWVPLLLACGTWTVYVGDRLLDTRAAIRTHNHGVLRERHYFHWRHRHTLIPLTALTAACSAGMIFGLMSLAARERNSLIATAALAYFSGVHAPAPIPRWARRIVSKEFLVGILFAAGCSGPTLPLLHSPSRRWPIVLTIVFLAVLAWLNCTAIAGWESEKHSINLPAVALLLALFGLGLAIILAPSFAPSSILLICAACSALLLLLLHRLRSRFDSLTLRALADVVLLIPAILLIPGAGSL